MNISQKIFRSRLGCAMVFILSFLVSTLACADLNSGLVQGGLVYHWYQGQWSTMPDLAKQTPAGYGVASGFDLAAVPATSNYAVRYDAYITIPVAGNYTFYTSSDDGSMLYVNGLPVVNNDGLHGMQTRTGTVSLTPGTYPVRVDFFQAGGGAGLSVGYTSPAGVTSPVSLNDLSYDPALLPLPREADLPSGQLYSGLAYNYYQGNWSTLPNFDTLTPVLEGVSSGFDLTDRLSDYQYGFRHQGYLVVPSDGHYTFYTSSDDGSAFYIGNQLVVNNDGLHGLQERSGSIELKAGLHRITTTFFQLWGGASLQVQWAGPQFTKSAIPAQNLLHTMDMLPPLVLPDVPAGPLQQGLAYGYYQGNWTALPDFSTLQPVTFGIANALDLGASPGIYQYGLSYKGYIEVPEDGVYRFFTTSDDGSRLWIGNQLVVNNDGVHGAVKAYGNIALAAGIHALRLDYFQGWGGQQLVVEYRTPSGVVKTIPAASLFHTADQLPVLKEATPPPADLASGLAYTYYQGSFASTTQLMAGKPRGFGTVDTFNVTPNASYSSNTYQYGFVYEGYIDIPQDGYYRFSTESDDGSRFWLDDSLLVDNDGYHGSKTVYASAGLKAGLHKVRVAYFQGGGGDILKVSYTLPDGSSAVIPATALHHTPSQLPPLQGAVTLPATATAGLAYRYFEGNWSNLPDFSAIQPTLLGTTNNFGLSLAPRNNSYGLRFDGYINVPVSGFYDFYTNSDDGSQLWIDGQLVTNNDGLHGAVDAVGTIGLLPGWHNIRVTYMQGWGGQNLNVSWRLPGGIRTPVPDTALAYDSVTQLPALVNPVAVPPELLSGLAFSYYQGSYSSTTQMMAAKPRTYGTVDTFSTAPNAIYSSNSYQYGFVYDGYIDIPQDGFYRFSSQSDDGSRLWIDGNLVVDNDGVHGDKTVYSSLGLKAGLHQIRGAFFQGWSGSIFKISYMLPNGSMVEIPATVLHHTSGQLPTPQPAVTVPVGARPGLAYRYYEGNWTALPDLNTQTPLGMGALNNFTLDVAARSSNYAFRYDGYINVPVTGFYDFYTNSDDGSQLWIDGELVTNNDGLHGARDAVGSKGLAAGWHTVRVAYFQSGGGQTLNVSWMVPGSVRMPVPDSALVFDPATMPALSPPTAAPSALLSGLQYAYYEWKSTQAAWSYLPDPATLTPVASGTITGFDLSPRRRQNQYAIRYTGYIDIPEYGYYSFFTASDDGSRLYIDNNLVVNNDGLHSLKEVSGRLGLERGRHSITVDFFQWYGNQNLSVSYQGPHFAKTPVVPAVLFRLDPARNGDPGNPGAPVGPTAPSADKPPITVQDQVATGIGAGQGVVVNVIGNDSDPDGDILMLSGVRPASGFGAALFDPTGGNVIYYPPLGFTGQDTLLYTASDRRGGTTDGQLTITVGSGTTVQMTPSEAGRLLTQATFGPTRSSLAEVMQKGASAWVNEQLAMSPTLHGPALGSMSLPGETPTVRTQRVRAWLDRAVNAPDQLRQRVAFALSEILVVSDQVNALGTDNGAPGATDYYDLLVRSAFGNYRQLLADVTLHPAMGLYLNAAGNQKADPVLGTVPDENFSREIMQLMTIGLWQLGMDGHRLTDANGQPVPSYGINDVMELSKVFTGWNYAASQGPDRYKLPMVLNSALHDDGQKRLLDGTLIPAGQGGGADLGMALDTLAAQPGLPPFIARQLIQRLVTSNPSPAYINRVATAFRTSGLNLGAAVKAILLDPEARTAPLLTVAVPVDGKVREPLLQLTALWRGLGVNPTSIRLRLDQVAMLGQTPLSAPSVFNFFKPDYQSPGDIASLNLYSPELSITDEKQEMNSASLIDDWTLGGQVNYSLNMELAYSGSTADKVVGHLNSLFMMGQMSDAMQQVLKQTLFDQTGLSAGYSDQEKLNRLLGAVYLILTSPEFQTQR